MDACTCCTLRLNGEGIRLHELKVRAGQWIESLALVEPGTLFDVHADFINHSAGICKISHNRP
jgi:hypothetical protein